MDINDPLAAVLGIDLADSEQRRGAELAYQDQNWMAALVRFRRASNLTQEDVAERMKTSQEAVSRFEKLGNDPRVSTVRRYAMAIGADYSHTVPEAPTRAEITAATWNGAFTYIVTGVRQYGKSGSSSDVDVRPLSADTAGLAGVG